ncbi:YihY family inner membrane protein [Neisseria leonii]|uniref:YihY family inner membrane protein n=1 Tax=Neisseria leonii TaxID=2995413 RepID=UPI0030D30616
MLKNARLQAWRQSRLFGFALFLLRRFNEVGVPQVSASLTFTTLLALVPIFTVALVVVSAFPVFSDFSAAVMSFIQSTLVPSGADTVLAYLETFKNKASNLTVIGIIFLGITSLMLIQTIDQTFNRIWRVENRRPLWLQFLVYWALLTFGPLALGISLSIWGLLPNYSRIGELPFFLGQLFSAASSVLLNTAILWLLYRLVPNRYVPAKHALAGALFTAVLLEAARRGFAYYVGNFNSYELIYGAFAAIPVFLIWLNLLWTILLTGAVLTASLSYWRGDAFRRKNTAARLDDVLQVLILLHRAQQDGRALHVQDFRDHINMGYDGLGDLLDRLARTGYTYHGKQGWVLKTAADQIRLDTLFREFVYRPQADNAINRAVGRMTAPCLDTLDLSLAEFEARLNQTAA